jgi:hypothetical protein
MVVRLPLVTTSQLRMYRLCPRLHYHAYELGYRPVKDESEALAFGTLIHRGLEVLWLTSSLDAALDALRERTVDDYDLARAEVLLIGYRERWRFDATEWETAEVEREFRTRMVNPETGAWSRTFDLGGKLDAIAVQRSTGHAYVVEHKTSTEDIGPGSVYWQRLQLDQQVSIYYAGARSLGYEPMGVLYDVVRRPMLRPLKATPVDARKYRKDGTLYAAQREQDESPEEYRQRVAEHIAENPDHYYMRGTVVRLATEESDAAYDVWSTARTLRESQLAKRWPKNPDACSRYNQLCWSFGVCTGKERLDDPELFGHQEHQHRELTADNDNDSADETTTVGFVKRAP